MLLLYTQANHNPYTRRFYECNLQLLYLWCRMNDDTQFHHHQEKKECIVYWVYLTCTAAIWNMYGAANDIMTSSKKNAYWMCHIPYSPACFVPHKTHLCARQCSPQIATTIDAANFQFILLPPCVRSHEYCCAAAGSGELFAPPKHSSSRGVAVGWWPDSIIWYDYRTAAVIWKMTNV